MDKNSFVKDDYHNPSLAKEDQEVTEQLYRGWLHYWNHESRQDFANGMNGAHRLYDFEDMLSYDMFGNTIRGSFKEHFDSIFPYWNDGYKDFQVTALSKDYAFSTMIQHTWGTAGGVPFDTAFGSTGIARKNSQGEWRWIHEHLSFPANMRTKEADFTAWLDLVKATKLA
ncbi:hypothetical protein N0V84_009248 [Fusarium piperis]|uniref:SnoaL-like domain-containing protein n=1 Tax=Fusarium piperis TaxID=1435070 RepID=A0A9W8W6M5_9HYPO|nr:hypothetical protein N0V84_009248 [Fusarium piperis]